MRGIRNAETVEKESPDLVIGTDVLCNVNAREIDENITKLRNLCTICFIDYLVATDSFSITEHKKTLAFSERKLSRMD